MKTINELCDAVRETAYAIHVYIGHRFQIKKYVRSERPAVAVAGRLSAFLFNFFALIAFFRG